MPFKSLYLALMISMPGLLHSQSAQTVSHAALPDDKPVPKSVVETTRLFRERLLADPHRPGYHFVMPEDVAVPGDPNGAFFHNGRYHLMYLYKREGSGFSWGHISSKDLLHWRHHPDALVPGNGDDGVFSGGAFVDKDGKATLTYWEFINQSETNKVNFAERQTGISIAQSSDEHFDVWLKSADNPMIRSTDWGITETTDKNGKQLIYGSADPSNIWMKDGKYYMLTGNLLVLNKYGRKDDSQPQMQGDHAYLFESADMKSWNYRHEFYKSDRKWTEKSEDNMCASFMPLPATADGGKPSGKHLLLFISHNKGCQYYVGSYKDDKFIPDNHGRMTWKDNAYFAPEALIDGKGRQIMWSWIFDDRPDSLKTYYGYTGVYGLPRTLWLGPDGALRMAPVPELQALRQNEKSKKALVLKGGSRLTLEGFGSDMLELEITIQPGTATQYGVKVGVSDDGREETSLYYDATQKALVCDATRSSLDMGRRNIESAPLELVKGEQLVLRVFVDRGIVEVFANNKQAIGRSVYPVLKGRGVQLFANGGDAKIVSVKAWELMPTNPY